MKNLKKALCLVLAVTMIMGLMVIGTSAANFTDKDEIVNKDAVNVMSALNIINGKGDGSYFDPKGIVTRAEMAKMICVALNGGRDPQLGNAAYSFTDTKNHWAAGYIEYCYNLGIIAGRGEGIFDPNGTVTGSEAAKMLLVALGYDAQTEGFVGTRWDVNVNIRASEKSLYAGLETLNPSAGLSRDNAAQMIYNALNANTVKYTYQVLPDGNGNWTTKGVAEDTANTILNSKFGLKIDTGVMLASGAYALPNQTPAVTAPGAGKVMVDIQGTRETYNFAGAADVVDLVGQEVNVLYKQPTATSPKTVYGVYATSRNLVVTATRNTVLNYYDGKVWVGTTAYPAVASVISAVDAYTATPSGGYVASADKFTFIDNNGDGAFDLLLKEPVVIEKVSYVGTTVFNTDGGSYVFANVNVYAGVAVGDYVVKTTEKYTGKTTFTKATTIQGTVTGASVVSSRNMIKVNGVWYYSSRTTADGADNVDLSTVALGANLKLVVVGDIIYAKEAVTSPAVSSNLLYLAAVGAAVTDPFTGVAGNVKNIRIALADGTVSVVTGVKWDPTTSTASALVDGSDKGAIYTYTVVDNVYYLTPATTANTGYTGTVSGSVNTTTDKLATAFIADDARFFVEYGTTTKTIVVLTGAQVKAWANGTYSGASGFTQMVNGLPYVKLGVINLSAATLPGAAPATKYGYIIADPYNVKEGTTHYTLFYLWDGTTTLALKQVTSDAFTIDNDNIGKGYLVQYTDHGNGLVSSTTVVGTRGAVTGFDGYNIAIHGAASGITTVAPNAKIIAINTATKTGVEGGAIQLAPQIAVGGLDYAAYLDNIYVLATNPLDATQATVVAVDVSNKLPTQLSGYGVGVNGTKIGVPAAALADTAAGRTAAATFIANYISNVVKITIKNNGTKADVQVGTVTTEYDLVGIPATPADSYTVAQLTDTAALATTLNVTSVDNVAVDVDADGSGGLSVGDTVAVTCTALNGATFTFYCTVSA